MNSIRRRFSLCLSAPVFPSLVTPAAKAALAGMLAVAALSSGCAFDRYRQVEVVSDPPGARIEVNGDFVGCAPTLISMLIERDGEVCRDYAIRAYPTEPDYYPQAKVYLKRVRGKSDILPRRVYFDMRVRQPAAQPATAPQRQRPWP